MPHVRPQQSGETSIVGARHCECRHRQSGRIRRPCGVSRRAGDLSDEWVGYYPEYGELLPDGRLRVKTSGRTDGEIWDGCIEVGPDDPRYPAWAERLRNKDRYFAERDEAIREARRQRRAAGRTAPGVSPESSAAGPVQGAEILLVAGNPD